MAGAVTKPTVLRTLSTNAYGAKSAVTKEPPSSLPTRTSLARLQLLASSVIETYMIPTAVAITKHAKNADLVSVRFKRISEFSLQYYH
jgi:hypothetical protein